LPVTLHIQLISAFRNAAVVRRSRLDRLYGLAGLVTRRQTAGRSWLVGSTDIHIHRGTSFSNRDVLSSAGNLLVDSRRTTNMHVV
jgi:hypothetical protein